MNEMPKYWDNAATTPVDQRVLDAMLPYFAEIFGNASSNHIYGRKAKAAINTARNYVADLINADSKEIFFTSGATESINWAIKGFLEANPEKGNHIITVKTEHKAVLNTCEYLETKGVEVTYLNVDENGLINLNELKDSIRPETSLVCVMYVNNEIGIIQDIQQIGSICTQDNVAFFCDATQAVGKIPVDVQVDKIDMLCLSGHKFNGPKGIGALYVKKGIKLAPLIHGGGQESGMRGGTYNTPLIVGIGEAARIAKIDFEKNAQSFRAKRVELETYLLKNNIATINFQNQNTAPHIISVSLINKDAEDFILEHASEFAISTGSACNSGINTGSHVYRHVFINKENINIRISIDHDR
jgi:cysteine desulfurase